MFGLWNDSPLLTFDPPTFCRCSNGYYGQPTEPGGSCQPCQCHGNLDPSAPQSCDPLTGACLKCREGYGGAACDSCAEGYFGDAVKAKNCQHEWCLGSDHVPHVPTMSSACLCHVNGSVSEVCDPATGQCQCRQHVVGRQCDECMFWMGSSGGLPENEPVGPTPCATASDSLSSPHRHVKPNCWWDAEQQACRPCSCSPVGAMSRRCDLEGRCICKPGFVGRRCDLGRLVHERRETRRETRRPVQQVPLLQAERWPSRRTGGCPRGAYLPKGPSTFGIQQGRGCVPCHCNSFGSKSFDCDERGQCRCQPGVTGLKCDRCARGYFNFQEGGCTRRPCFLFS
ncbi:hypothetical protein Z043_103969 [Scleropages formosus]|uniref:Laminin EGF-like domain-containing protein n=1 Tax=Scleropages formosus TaxID=113540 RepID=A0A0N8K240_SCLFO|nr:hypothetical protein Z043_103969 [Scleropages formosus]